MPPDALASLNEEFADDEPLTGCWYGLLVRVGLRAGATTLSIDGGMRGEPAVRIPPLDALICIANIAATSAGPILGFWLCVWLGGSCGEVVRLLTLKGER